MWYNSITFTLKMATAQVVKTSIIVISSHIQDYKAPWWSCKTYLSNDSWVQTFDRFMLCAQMYTKVTEQSLVVRLTWIKKVYTITFFLVLLFHFMIFSQGTKLPRRCMPHSHCCAKTWRFWSPGWTWWTRASRTTRCSGTKGRKRSVPAMPPWWKGS